MWDSRPRLSWIEDPIPPVHATDRRERLCYQMMFITTELFNRHDLLVNFSDCRRRRLSRGTKGAFHGEVFGGCGFFVRGHAVERLQFDSGPDRQYVYGRSESAGVIDGLQGLPRIALREGKRQADLVRRPR